MYYRTLKIYLDLTFAVIQNVSFVLFSQHQLQLRKNRYKWISERRKDIIEMKQKTNFIFIFKIYCFELPIIIGNNLLS